MDEVKRPKIKMARFYDNYGPPAEEQFEDWVNENPGWSLREWQTACWSEPNDHGLIIVAIFEEVPS